MSDWRIRGLCCQVDPELWFPIGTVGPAVESQIAEAKAICRRCPVTEACLSWALESGVTDGIFGGATPDERREMQPRPVVRERAA